MKTPTLTNVNKTLACCAVCLLFFVFNVKSQVSFNPSPLVGASLSVPTSLQFGPDGRLYVAEQSGVIKAFTIVKNASNQYQVTDTETILLVKQIPNHYDNGTPKPYNINSNKRQITGIYVAGTAANPVIYASSSDPDHAQLGNDSDLDGNSGILSRLTWNGNSWSKIDLVRGLPRSEENHSTNGMQLDESNNKLFVAQSGNTNAGSPSNNFAFLCETALSAAILMVDLDAIDELPTLGTATAHPYKYDLPTVDDPTRANNPDGSDVGDPFGGNDGINQAKIVPGGPVQVYSPGYRNAYDLVLTKTPGKERRLYTIDNGGNPGWGGFPDQEGPEGNATNNYLPAEPGSNGPGQNDPMVNNLDGVHFIGQIDTYVPGSYYGGHPNPIRANPSGAGIYTYAVESGSGTGVWRTSTTDPTSPLPADWPPLPLANANPVEGDYQNPGETDNSLLTFSSSTNGFAEYTASNFGGALRGDLIAAAWDGYLFRIKLNEQGDAALNSMTTGQRLNLDPPLASGFGSKPLDIIAQGDNDIFPGTLWATTYGSNAITIFEPAETPCSGAYDLLLDEDGDCYTNADEIDNGTDPCSGASKPSDFNGNCLSDLNDLDDDSDGIADVIDIFVRDPENGTTTNLPVELTFNNDGLQYGGFFNVGWTGLMTNYASDYLDMFDENKLITTGAAGVFTVFEVPEGDALSQENDQMYGFQFGINVSETTGPFVVKTRMTGPFFNGTTPVDYKSQGLFIGNGDQDNYLKIVLNANGGLGGIQVVHENNGTASSYQYPVPAFPASSVELFLFIDPVAGTAQPAFKLDGTPLDSAGTPLALQDAILSAVQGTQALALGIIATSKDAGTPFSAGWDYVKAEKVAAQTGTVIYRVNAGGSAMAPKDFSQPVYAEDSQTNPSPYVNAAQTNNKVYSLLAPISLDPSVPASVPADLFLTQRYNGLSNLPALAWDFPVQQNTNLIVRLLFAESFFTQPGSRVFDIVIEDSLRLNDYDIFADVGLHVGVMKDFPVQVNDNNLDIDLVRIIQNPGIQGIEIISLDNQQPLVAHPIPDQSAMADVWFSYVFPENTFTDVDGDTLTYTTSLSNGQALPGWLSFEASNPREFTGTPGNDDVGEIFVMVTANDLNGGSQSDIFALLVEPNVASPTFTPLYRINAGGGTLQVAGNGGLPYAADTKSDPSPYVNAAQTNNKTYGTNDAITLHNSVPTDVPVNLFQTQRFNGLSGEPSLNWDFPVALQAQLEIRLYFAETYFQQAGSRIFNVVIEDTVRLANYDIYTDVGHDVGVMQSFLITTTDTNLDINLVRITQNPAIQGIEIISLLNLTPQLSNAIPGQTTAPGVFYSYLVPDNTFTDPDGDSLTYTAALANGNPLPVWLNFNATTRIFSGTPLALDVGEYAVQVTVDDHKAGTASTVFTLTVMDDGVTVLYRINAGGSELQAADTSLPAYSADTQNSPYPFVNYAQTNNKTYATAHTITLSPSVPAHVPSNLFKTQRYNGLSAVPALAWNLPVQPNASLEVHLYFAEIFFQQAGSRVFDVVIEGITQLAGYDIYADVGHDVGVRKTFIIQTTDSILDIDLVRITQNPVIQGIEIFLLSQDSLVNLPPVVINPIPDQSGMAGAFFTYAFAENTFTDPEGDTLAYSATLNNGLPLPAWLSFDGSQRTFSGTPADIDVGNYTLIVTTNDGNGGSASDLFILTINAAPDSSAALCLYRINAGGNSLQALDNSLPAFEPDTKTAASAYVNAAQTGNKTFSSYNTPSAGPSVPPHVPAVLFQSQRYNGLSGVPSLSWDFPVEANKTLEVRLYFAETYFQQPGARVFNIIIEDTVRLAAYDAYADAGFQVGSMKSFTIHTTDANLDIDLKRIVQNPAIQGIEIYQLGAQDPLPASAAFQPLASGELGTLLQEGQAMEETGLRETTNQPFGFFVYPNPALIGRDAVNIAFTHPAGQAVSLEVYDLQGRKKMSVQLAPTDQLHYKMNILDLSPGIYLVKITTSSQAVQINKLVIERD